MLVDKRADLRQLAFVINREITAAATTTTLGQCRQPRRKADGNPPPEIEGPEQQILHPGPRPRKRLNIFNWHRVHIRLRVGDVLAFRHRHRKL
ncbi:MAG: hypothetical protein NTY53_18830 [Kiritimatiellaeota bacterium]|nr:hypothetical protein [Kiritimatiellota bacterium]